MTIERICDIGHVPREILQDFNAVASNFNQILLKNIYGSFKKHKKA